jgi:acetyl esterase/lipase
MMARDKNVSGIIGQILNFPVTCHPKHMKDVADKYELGSYIQNYDASVVNSMRMELFWDAYDPDANPEPYHSPLLAKSLRGLPTARKSRSVTFWNLERSCLLDLIVIQCAGLDPLRDEAIAYAEALKAAGVDVELYSYAGLPHCFSSLLLDLPQSREYYQRIEAFLDRLVKNPKSSL